MADQTESELEERELLRKIYNAATEKGLTVESSDSALLVLVPLLPPVLREDSSDDLLALMIRTMLEVELPALN